MLCPQQVVEFVLFLYVSIVGALIGISGASFTLIFFLINGNNKEITEYNKKQKEKAWQNSHVG